MQSSLFEASHMADFRSLRVYCFTKRTVLSKGHALELSVKTGLPGSPVGSGCALRWHWMDHLNTLYCELNSQQNPLSYSDVN
jgi:hypothetical protein